MSTVKIILMRDQNTWLRDIGRNTKRKGRCLEEGTEFTGSTEASATLRTRRANANHRWGTLTTCYPAARNQI